MLIMDCAYNGFTAVVVTFLGFRPYSYDSLLVEQIFVEHFSYSGNVVQRASVSREHILKPTKGKYSERAISDPKKKRGKTIESNNFPGKVCVFETVNCFVTLARSF